MLHYGGLHLPLEQCMFHRGQHSFHLQTRTLNTVLYLLHTCLGDTLSCQVFSQLFSNIIYTSWSLITASSIFIHHLIHFYFCFHKFKQILVLQIIFFVSSIFLTPIRQNNPLFHIVYMQPFSLWWTQFCEFDTRKGCGWVRENRTKTNGMIHQPFDRLRLFRCFVGEDTIMISHKHFCPLIFQCIGRERIKFGNKIPQTGS